MTIAAELTSSGALAANSWFQKLVAEKKRAGVPVPPEVEVDVVLVELVVVKAVVEVAVLVVLAVLVVVAELVVVAVLVVELG